MNIELTALYQLAHKLGVDPGPMNECQLTESVSFYALALIEEYERKLERRDHTYYLLHSCPVTGEALGIVKEPSTEEGGWTMTVGNDMVRYKHTIKTEEL